MAHQYSRIGFKSSVEVNEVNLTLSYGGVSNYSSFSSVFVEDLCTQYYYVK